MPPSPAPTDGHDRRVLATATLASLAIGLACVFVRSPLPWGWEGIDRYHQRALALARGAGLQTLDVPAGYTLFLAAFYRVFGDRPVVPLVAQVLLNALVPFMMYRLVRIVHDRRTAAITALLVGVFSFNTIYGSTQASDAVCNVLFVAGMLILALACRDDRVGLFALAGVAFGVASQFRPNLILFPLVAAAYAHWRAPRQPRAFGRWRQSLAILVSAAAVCTPWTIFAYALTGEFIPTSTHGSTQLFYGTLQVGPYLQSRVNSPRAAFEFWGFPTTSMSDRRIFVTAQQPACATSTDDPLQLVWWTDRDAQPARTTGDWTPGDRWRFTIPGQPAPTAVYYDFAPTPASEPAASSRPRVHFVIADQLRDPDRHGDLLDVFDVARIAGHLTWGDPLPFADRLDTNGDGVVDRRDLDAVVGALLDGRQPSTVASLDIVRGLTTTGESAVLQFVDGSTLTVPRHFEKYTDLDSTWKLAGLLLVSVRPMVAWRPPILTPPAGLAGCAPVTAAVNETFSRRDPDDMHRNMALAMDNIQRSPAAFLLASAYRAYRVFVIAGGSDVNTIERFRGDTVVYPLARSASLTFFLLFLCGIAVSVWRQRVPLLLLGPPIYVAATIAPVLTNMRYSVTIQPFMLAFTAIVMRAALDRVAAIGHAGTVKPQ